MRKRAEVENTGKNEATGPRKPKDILGNKVSVKVSKVSRAASHLSPPPTLQHPHEASWVDGDFLLVWEPEGRSLNRILHARSIYFLFFVPPGNFDSNK